MSSAKNKLDITTGNLKQTSWEKIIIKIASSSGLPWKMCDENWSLSVSYLQDSNRKVHWNAKAWPFLVIGLGDHMSIILNALEKVASMGSAWIGHYVQADVDKYVCCSVNDEAFFHAKAEVCDNTFVCWWAERIWPFACCLAVMLIQALQD